jgi:hypothetical protein
MRSAGTAIATAALGLSVAFTAGAATAATPSATPAATAPAGMPMAGHHNRGQGMPAMDSEAMTAMHTAMRDTMPPEVRAACDEAHAGMMAATTGEAGAPAAHAAHHPS